MTHTDPTHETAAWETNLTPWISPFTDPPMALAIAAPTEAEAAHPISTNADHTGLRTSIAQYRLPRIKVTSKAA